MVSQEREQEVRANCISRNLAASGYSSIITFEDPFGGRDLTEKKWLVP